MENYNYNKLLGISINLNKIVYELLYIIENELEKIEEKITVEILPREPTDDTK